LHEQDGALTGDLYLKVFIKGIGFHVKIGLAPTLETEYVVCFVDSSDCLPKNKKKKKEKRAVGKGRQKGVDCVPVHLLAASLASSASFSVGRN